MSTVFSVRDVAVPSPPAPSLLLKPSSLPSSRRMSSMPCPWRASMYLDGSPVAASSNANAANAPLVSGIG